MPAPLGNKFALGNHWGSPPKYETAEDLAAKCLEYFKYCEGEFKEVEKKVKDEETGEESVIIIIETIRPPEQPRISSLCLFIGFESRCSFDYQAKRGEDFAYIVKRAKLLVADGYEQDLRGKAFAGAIFALKNMGWSDKTESVVSIDANVEQKVRFEAYGQLSDAALEEIARLESSDGEGGAMPA